MVNYYNTNSFKNWFVWNRIIVLPCVFTLFIVATVTKEFDN